MKKTVISWDVFRAAVAREEPWLLTSWIAFTGDDVVVVSKGTESEEPVLETSQGCEGVLQGTKVPVPDGQKCLGTSLDGEKNTTRVGIKTSGSG